MVFVHGGLRSGLRCFFPVTAIVLARDVTVELLFGFERRTAFRTDVSPAGRLWLM
jgi:hypothetical protein